MRPFRNLPLRHKLTLAAMIAAAAALAVAVSLSVPHRLQSIRARFAERSETLADIIAGYCESPVAAGDAAAVQRGLEPLHHMADILAACIYRLDGTLLASYARGPAGGVALPAAPAADGSWIENHDLVVARPVRLPDGRRVGTIVLRSDARQVYDRLLELLAFGAGALAAAVLTGWIISRRLSRSITRPIFELSALMETVARQKDYSLRAKTTDGGDLGQLANGFNQMLAAVQEREESLRLAHDSRARRQEQLQEELQRRVEAEQKLKVAYDDVERKVRERTAELQRANESLRTEITRRERAVADLDTAETRFKALVENSSEVIVLLSSEAVITYVSPTVIRVLGYTPEELLESDALQWVHPEDQERLRRDLDELLRNPHSLNSERYRLRHRDGSWRWVESLGENMLVEAGVHAVVVNLRDITARCQAEQEVARAAQEWQTTFDAANDAIWLLDKEQRVVRSNKIARQTFPSLGGSNAGLHCYELVHGTARPIPECPVQRARKSLRREAMEWQVGGRWYQITADPILDAAGQYDGAVHILRDITEGKRANEALQRRFAVEQFLSSASNRLANVTGPEADAAI